MEEVAAKPCNRLHSLDALRGLAVAVMIVVTSPGTWDTSYSQLKHAEWQGWTLADLVFPDFLFGVGMALALSFPKPWGEAESALAWRRVARRTALLIALGLVLNALPYFDLANLRIPGILQRIALCYAAAASLCLLTLRRDAEGRAAIDPRAPAIAAVALLVAYWALLTFVPVPGYGAGHLDPAGNLPGYVDRAVFTVPHMWKYGVAPGMGVTYDPEGLLSTLPATVNVLGGVLAAVLLRRSPRVWIIAAIGIALAATGLLLDPVIPLIKRIWTDSFALFTIGASMIALAAMVTADRVPALRAATYPLRVLGGNAILAFVLQQLWAAFNTIGAFRDATGNTEYPEHILFGWWRTILGPYDASLAAALTALFVILLILLPLNRRGIHLRL